MGCTGQTAVIQDCFLSASMLPGLCALRNRYLVIIITLEPWKPWNLGSLGPWVLGTHRYGCTYIYTYTTWTT